MPQLLSFDPTKEKISASTQDHLDIETIIDSLIVLKSGVVALVLQTSAVNFDLLSEFEQESKIKAFAGLINSIDFNMQILIRTNKVDISDYIRKLKDMNIHEQSPLIRRQIEIYTEFVKKMTIKNEVLDKKFFIVIPSRPNIVAKTSALKQIFGKEEKIVNVDQILKDAKPNVYPKRDHVIRQLGRIGLQARQLTTDELINLFYSLYNPDSVTISGAGLSFDMGKRDSGETTTNDADGEDLAVPNVPTPATSTNPAVTTPTSTQ
jgi:hypothetical protein